MTDEEHEEGKAKALRYYKLLAMVKCVLGGGLLACGIIAQKNVDKRAHGPPYYVGGFIVGIMALISSFMCILIIVRANKPESNLQKRELDCAMLGEHIMPMFMILGCLASTVLAGTGGFHSNSNRSTLNKNLAIAILVGCILGMFVTFCSLCITRTYRSYFGVSTNGRRGRGRRGRARNTNLDEINAIDDGDDINSLASGAKSCRVDELERQNELLKEQLELQRELNEQQQQQQQQQPYGLGFEQLPPTEMYNTSPGRIPSAPPPSYNELLK